MTFPKSPLTRIFLLLIRGYQLLFSSLFGRSCRYHPTCSSYTVTAINRFGALKGGFMGFCRICRCHPFHPGGYDPVPEKWQNPFGGAIACAKSLFNSRKPSDPIKTDKDRTL